MFWIPSFYQASKDSKNPDDENDNWIKSIFGLEIWFVMDLKATVNSNNVWNICLLAENDKWYHNMMELVAYANQTWLINGVPQLDLNILREKSEWIVVFAWWDYSWISKLQSTWESDNKIKEIYDMIHDIFWENCYLEITAQNEKILPIIKKCNNYIYNLAKQTNTKLLVNNDYRYVRKDDKEIWEVALSIKDWTRIYDNNRRSPQWLYHIMDWDEIKKICIDNWYLSEEIDEWIQNNYDLSLKLNANMLLNQKLFPKYKTPDEIMQLYEKYGESSIVN